MAVVLVMFIDDLHFQKKIRKIILYNLSGICYNVHICGMQWKSYLEGEYSGRIIIGRFIGRIIG